MTYKVNWWINLGIVERNGTWEFDHDPSEEELRDSMQTELSNEVDAGYGTPEVSA